jgi:hypothetical protein
MQSRDGDAYVAPLQVSLARFGLKAALGIYAALQPAATNAVTQRGYR